MNNKKPVLGGASSFLAGVALSKSDHIPTVIEVTLDNILPDPEQPRRHFDAASIEELADSIKTKGLLQPITVRRNPEALGQYIIVAGERRWRAHRVAGLPSIACVLTTGDPAELSLIENMQRADLNPIEEAEAIERLMTQRNYTHETVAKVLGKSRVTITERLAVLRLPVDVRERARALDLRASALKNLARMDEDSREEALAKAEAEGGLTARDSEALKSKKVQTPAKLAAKALYASIERLGQIEERLKVDEMRLLREAKAKLDEAYKTVTARKE